MRTMPASTSFLTPPMLNRCGIRIAYLFSASEKNPMRRIVRNQPRISLSLPVKSTIVQKESFGSCAISWIAIRPKLGR